MASESESPSGPPPSSGADPAGSTDDSSLALRLFVAAGVVAVTTPVSWLFAVILIRLGLGQLEVEWLADSASALLVPAPFALGLGIAVARRGLRRGWHRRAWVVKATAMVAISAVALAGLFVMELGKVRRTSTDKAVLSNLRWLAAAADQYFLDNGVTTVSYAALVGPDKYVKAVNPIAGETYPPYFTRGAALTASGIAGARTVTYSP